MEAILESSGDAAVLSEENGYSEPAVNHLDGDVKQHSMLNGLSNGYDKEKKDKERHKDRDKHDKDKYREKDKNKERDSDREKHRSKDGDKDKHREKDKHKDHKEKDRDKEKHRDKDKERDKEKDRDKNKEKDKERDKDRDKSKSSSSSSKDKHSSSSSSSKDKDKERKDRDREKEKEKSKHQDDKERKDKEHKSSSSSSKDKEHKSSSSSKHSSSSSSKPSSESTSKDKEHKDKEKDKERDKNRDKEKDKERSKDKHSSSSSKDKDRHSSDKHKSDKEKDKHSSSSSKDKDRHSSEKKDKHKEKERSKDKEKEKSKEKEKEKSAEVSILETSHIKSEPAVVKEEFSESFSFQPSIKEESMDIDDDDGKLMIKEEPTDDESKLESSFDSSAFKNNSSIKQEDDDDDDVPMAARMAKIKREIESDDEDDIPLIARKKPKKEGSAKKRKKEESDDDEEDFKPAKKKKQQIKKETKSTKVKQESITESPKKRKKKEEEEQEVWKWWEEEKKPDGVKWTFLEHKGPVFAPAYEPLPPNVKFYYDGDEMKLSESAEEVATFYARMLDHDYTTKEAFNKNFMHDWRKVMTRKEQETITSLKKCNFKHMHAYFIKLSEERKAMSKEEKKAIKDKNEELQKEYGFCTIDGHKEKIGNFKIEPPGLFRGRGEHPKMGKLKQRVVSEDIIINCSKGSKVPPPPPGHKWKEVRHDNTVTWLASWTENVQGQVKYIMLNPSSKLKGEKDWQKYETARKLAKSIDKIREDYTADWKSKEMKIRQRAVAMYFIDKLALRAGNEKDEDQADTVGCCSLRVEHIQLFEEKDGKDNVVVFDFLGKDSIRYYNEVPVERRVFKNLMLFMENKKPQDDLFDRLNTAVLNKHLSDLMDGLTAKVFRTYNASWTLQAQLKELTDPDSSIAEKLLSYNRANRAVAILCNHQRAVPKTHDKSMANLREKLAIKRAAVEEAEKNYKNAKRDAKNGSAKERIAADKSKKTLERLREQLLKLELMETDKEENKCIALGTSKLNYLDPRISVAWCKKYEVPIEKIYNKTQRDKFRWAIDMATADYVF